MNGPNDADFGQFTKMVLMILTPSKNVKNGDHSSLTQCCFRLEIIIMDEHWHLRLSKLQEIKNIRINFTSCKDDYKHDRALTCFYTCLSPN